MTTPMSPTLQINLEDSEQFLTPPHTTMHASSQKSKKKEKIKKSKWKDGGNSKRPSSKGRKSLISEIKNAVPCISRYNRGSFGGFHTL